MSDMDRKSFLGTILAVLAAPFAWIGLRDQQERSVFDHTLDVQGQATLSSDKVYLWRRVGERWEKVGVVDPKTMAVEKWLKETPRRLPEKP